MFTRLFGAPSGGGRRGGKDDKNKTVEIDAMEKLQKVRGGMVERWTVVLDQRRRQKPRDMGGRVVCRVHEPMRPSA